MPYGLMIGSVVLAFGGAYVGFRLFDWWYWRADPKTVPEAEWRRTPGE
jgi:hypothetical protein